MYPELPPFNIEPNQNQDDNHQQLLVFNPQQTFVDEIPPTVFKDFIPDPTEHKPLDTLQLQQDILELTPPEDNEISQDKVESTQGHQTLFQLINQELVDRPVRKQV